MTNFNNLIPSSYDEIYYDALNNKVYFKYNNVLVYTLNLSEIGNDFRVTIS